jgi:glycine dehydrogenase
VSQSDLDPAPEFWSRHLGLAPDSPERAQALAGLGLGQDDSIMEQALPAFLRSAAPDLPAPASEEQVAAELAGLAQLNRAPKAMIGLGYYGAVTPAVLRRGVLENPAWYTAYTPYQPEISQGRLEVLMTFQTMVADLTGLPTACASLLDEATAAAEAMTLCWRVDRGRRPRFAVASDVFPQTWAVLANRCEPLGIELVRFDPVADPAPDDVNGVLVQYQAADGRLIDLEPLAQAVHAQGALLAVAADPLALTLLRAPGQAGADIALGSTQRFGCPIGFGGPHAAYFAVRAGLERQLPGRLVGLSRDSAGQPALRLAIQTREQHIRREKATSNICTAQVLLAAMAALYAVWHGPEGLRRIAGQVHQRAVDLAATLTAGGLELAHPVFFDTVAVKTPGRAEAVKAAARQFGLAIWAADADTVWVSTDQTTSSADLGQLVAACGLDDQPLLAQTPTELPAELRRTTPYLTDPVFSRHHSETEMMRYLRRLADRDYALDRGMIPLGSCTMKLSAASQMEPITWPALANLHPFVEAADAEGSLALLGDLERWLQAVTGYDAVSLQPNAGSQGELAGLLTIRRYHLARDDRGRDVCLIPTSAHGTNAASAALAGWSVVPVATTDSGDVDLEDLKAKIDQLGDRLAAIMITYPSTHGVYEEQVRQIADLVHAGGGQVYIDGANFNALVGWASLADCGGDVSHLNLHKTFAMPHGGGGPGVGPVACRAHLAPYLPGHPLAQRGRRQAPVAGAPFGSALLAPITWVYLRLMGAAGLARATEGAVLAANHIARRLDPIFPVLYRGRGGWVAHECILDLRGFTARTGVSVDDVAKRLVDYGFHAPTMSFPVAGTLMVEPTESESLAELDRFCAAMESIAAEADQVAAGRWPADDNPLHGAPHTAFSLVQDWTHPYSRAEAAYPQGPDPDKYWSPVGRVDGAWGDRHLVATWPQASPAEDE